MDDKKENPIEQASFDPSPNTEFLREKIKQKPLNKKKLIRRTLISVLSAAIFGLVACVTFIFLEPVISNKLNQSDEEAQAVTFNEVTDSDEISPEDMYANDTEMIEEAIQGNVDNVNQNIQNIEDMVSNIEFGVDDYQRLYSDLRTVADKISCSLVTVTGVMAEDEPDSEDSEAGATGVIVADNGISLLILVKEDSIEDAGNIRIEFDDGTIAAGRLVASDDLTGYSIVGVTRSLLSRTTLEAAVPVSLGSSRSTTLKGTPVMAVGSPTGVNDSLAYGMITTGMNQLDITDSDYCVFTTDITGTENSSGVIASLRGNVIGIIDNDAEADGPENMVKAIGITELKPLIEKLSNNEKKAYLGIKGTDVTQAMADTYDIPEGIYLNDIEIDSPAMSAGLQKGDVVLSADGKEMNSYHDLILWLYEAEPDSEVRLKVQRKSVEKYVTLEIAVTLGSVDYSANSGSN